MESRAKGLGAENQDQKAGGAHEHHPHHAYPFSFTISTWIDRNGACRIKLLSFTNYLGSSGKSRFWRASHWAWVDITRTIPDSARARNGFLLAGQGQGWKAGHALTIGSSGRGAMPSRAASQK